MTLYDECEYHFSQTEALQLFRRVETLEVELAKLSGEFHTHQHGVADEYDVGAMSDDIVELSERIKKLEAERDG